MRTVLITGGTRGLGRGIAQAFTDVGDRVVVCGRNPGDGPGRFVACDVRDPDAVDALVADVLAHEGSLDVVVNNAGGSPSALVAETSPRFHEKVIALNLVAPLFVARAARRAMDNGVILNIGSVSAVRPAPGTAAYAAAKAGLTTLTRALALEWAPDVRVNQVTVGLLETETAADTYGEHRAAVAATVPMGRLASVQDVAAACLMLASPEMAYVTGADLFVDGGGEIPSFHTALGSHGG
ncbi:MAG: short chain dehydrogenase [Frankiales bacterium]|jgi:NAD(P)-dependent dehydrogenase (short-subunit alcohol dehydrogenase family)|nr:short chain dehydrogenase [Frankiales bacterium]